MINRNSNKQIALGTGTNIYLGIIEDRKDPQMMGRFRVRVVGIHSANKQELPTAALPWATAMLPTTSPGLNGIGSNPFLLEGSWVVVMFMDSEFQEPLILGSIAGNTTEKRNQDMGFSDPRGFYPRAQIDEEGNVVDEKERKPDSDINRRARGEELDAILRKDPNNQERIVGKEGDSIPLDDPYDARYPYNHVFASESGHFIEFDDTPHKERINIQHRTGSFIEIHPNGDMRIRAKNLFNSSAHQVINVDGQCDLTIAQDCNVSIQGDTSISAIGNVLLEAEQDVLARVKGNTTLNSEKEITINSLDEISIVANANVNLDTTKNLYVNVIGEADENDSDSVEGVHIKTNNNLFIESLKNVDFDVGGNFSVTANGDIALEARGEHGDDKEDPKPLRASQPMTAMRFTTNEDFVIETRKNLLIDAHTNIKIESNDDMDIISHGYFKSHSDHGTSINAVQQLDAISGTMMNLKSKSTMAMQSDSGGMNINTKGILGLTSTMNMGIHAGGSLKASSSGRTDVVGSTVHLNSSSAGRLGSISVKPAKMKMDTVIPTIAKFEISKLETTTHQALGDDELTDTQIIEPIIRPFENSADLMTFANETDAIVTEYKDKPKYTEGGNSQYWSKLSNLLIKTELQPEGEIDLEVRFPQWQYKAPELEDITLERESEGLEEPQDPMKAPDFCPVDDDDCNTVLEEDLEQIERTPLYKTTDITDEDMNGRVTETFRTPGTIRNKPLQSNLKQYIVNAANQANVYVEIYSAGQDKQGIGRRRVGSHRHDDLGSGGRAADIYLFSDKQRTKRLRSDSNQAKTFIDAVISQGAKSIGAGHGYMGSYGIHVDVVDQTPDGRPAARYWGASGRRRNAWPFLKNNPRLT